MQISDTLSADDNIRAYKIYTTSYYPLFQKLAVALEQIYAEVEKAIEQDINNANATAISVFGIVLVMLGITVILTGVFTWLIARYIMVPVKELEVAANKMAQSILDVDIQYRSKDELGVLSAEM